MKAQLRGAAWRAVSSLPQAKKISLEEQERLIQEHATKHNIPIVRDFVVPGQSRSIILFEDACERVPAYKELKEAIENREFDVLFFYDRSRLGRKASLIMAVIELCHEAGIVIYEIESPPATLDDPSKQQSSANQIVNAIRAVTAQLDVSRLVRAHEFGIIARVRKGEMPGNIPYGYKAVYDPDGTRRIVVDWDEAKIVLKIIDFYVNKGLGTPKIADELNRLGFVRPDGEAWTRRSVALILERAWRYAGWAEVNKQSKNREYVRARGNWEAIITDETAQMVEAEQKRRVGARRTVARAYRFSLMVWCTICNRRARAGMYYSNNQAKKPYYRCTPSYKPSAHPRPNISEERVYAVLEDFMRRLAEDEEFRASLSVNDADTGETILDKIALAERRIEDAQKRLQRADDAWVSGVMDADRYRRQVEMIAKQIAATQEEIEGYRRSLAESENAQKLSARIEEVAAHGLRQLQNPDIRESNAWLRSRIRVWVTDGTVTEVEIL